MTVVQIEIMMREREAAEDLGNQEVALRMLKDMRETSMPGVEGVNGKMLARLFDVVEELDPEAIGEGETACDRVYVLSIKKAIFQGNKELDMRASLIMARSADYMPGGSQWFMSVGINMSKRGLYNNLREPEREARLLQNPLVEIKTDGGEIRFVTIGDSSMVVNSERMWEEHRPVNGGADAR